MQEAEKNKLTRLEVLLGFTLMAAGSLALMPFVGTILFEEPGQRAYIVAEDLAHMMVDLRQESGSWPTGPDGALDLTTLAAPAGSGAVGEGGLPVSRPLVREIPLDPWGRPYRAVLLERGRGVAVISAGPDGIYETATDRLWGRRGVAHAFDGDDAGCVLATSDLGGDR